MNSMRPKAKQKRLWFSVFVLALTLFILSALTLSSSLAINQQALDVNGNGVPSDRGDLICSILTYLKTSGRSQSLTSQGALYDPNQDGVFNRSDLILFISAYLKSPRSGSGACQPLPTQSQALNPNLAGSQSQALNPNLVGSLSQANRSGYLLTGSALKEYAKTQAQTQTKIDIYNQAAHVLKTQKNLTRTKLLALPEMRRFARVFRTTPFNIDKPASAQSSGGSSADDSTPNLPQAGQRQLPTTDGVSVAQFTGSLNTSYPINLPPLPGDLNISSSLTYSSRTVDELRLNLPDDKAKFEVQGPTFSPVGLGWSLSGLPSITQTKANQYLLNFNGNRYYLYYDWDKNQLVIYPSDPANPIKINRLVNSKGFVYGWQITTPNGLTYILGSDDGLSKNDHNKKAFANSATGYTIGVSISSGDRPRPYCWSYPNNWSLSKMVDRFGNRLTVAYQNVIDTNNLNGYDNCQYTKQTLVKQIAYNYDAQNKPQTTIDYQYQEFDSPETKTADSGQLRPSPNANQKIKLLTTIKVNHLNRLINAYHLNYNQPFINQKFSGRGYWFLTSITQKGLNDSGKRRPYRFCYEDLWAKSKGLSTKFCDGTSTNIKKADLNANPNYHINSIYLTQIDNGYGGISSFTYTHKPAIDNICVNFSTDTDKSFVQANYTLLCSTAVTINGRSYDFWPDPANTLYPFSRQHRSDFYVVSRLISYDASTSDSGAVKPIKVSRYQYQGRSTAYAKTIIRSQTDNQGSFSIYAGLRFLGYPKVVVETYEPVSLDQPDKVKTYLSKQVVETYQYLIKPPKPDKPNSIYAGGLRYDQAGSFMIDPRYGLTKTAHSFNQAGKLLSSQTNTYLLAGRPKDKTGRWWLIEKPAEVNKYFQTADKSSQNLQAEWTWNRWQAFNKQTQTITDGIKKTNLSFYDFEVDNRADRSFGRVVKQTQMVYHPKELIDQYQLLSSDVSKLHTYYRYLQPVDFAQTDNTCKPNGDPNQCRSLQKYWQAGLYQLKTTSFTSPDDIGLPKTKNGFLDLSKAAKQRRYHYQRFFYDTRPVIGGELFRTNRPYGLVTKTRTIVYGSAYDKPNQRIALDVDIDYNNKGLVVKTTDPYPVNSKPLTYKVTYYDPYLNLIPICTIKTLNSKSNPDPKDKLSLNDKGKCVSNQNQLATFYQYTPDSLAISKPKAVYDANSAKTTYDYDVYGRVVKVYAPHPTNKGQSLSTPTQLVDYYDDLMPMATRIRTYTFTDVDKGTYKTTDTIINGFGQTVSTITYNLQDTHGLYAQASYTVRNGLGQVTTQYNQIVLRHQSARLPSQPQPLSLNQVKSIITTVSSPNYPYPDKSQQVTYKYDDFSRPVETTTTAIDRTGKIKTTTKARHQGFVSHTYDAKNNLTLTITNGWGKPAVVINYLCQPSPNQTQAANCTNTNGQALITKTKYHPVLVDKVIRTYGPDGATINTYTYNTAGKLLTATNIDKGSTKYVYDKYLRLAEEIDTLGNRQKIIYDQASRPIIKTIQDAKGTNYYTLATKYDSAAHNALGKAYLTQVKIANWPNNFLSPNSTSSTPAPSSPLLLSQTENLFDLTGRITTTKDKVVNLTFMKDNPTSSLRYLETTTTQDYTPSGLLVKTQKQTNTGLGQVYHLSFSYDKAGALERVVDDQTNQPLASIDYQQSRLSRVSYGAKDSLSVYYDYDPAGRLNTKKTTAFNPIKDLIKTSYSYNFNGLLTQVKEEVNPYTLKPNPPLTTNYQYDSLGRLTQAGGNEVAGSYRFDTNGQLIKKQETSLITKIKSQASQIEYLKKGCQSNRDYVDVTGYDDKTNGCPYHAPKIANIITNNPNTSGTHYYLYDKKGRLVKEYIVKANTKQAYLYRSFDYQIPPLDLPTKISLYQPDKPNQPKTITYNYYVYPNIRLFSYTINPAANKVIDQTMTLSWYTKSRSLYGTNYDTKQIKETIHLPTPVGRIIKTRTKDPKTKKWSQWQTNYIFATHQGSTTLITNDQGQPIPAFSQGMLRYLPYGVIITPTNLNDLPTKHTYTNQLFDTQTNLYYYNARYYDANLGAFIQADPVQDNISRYMYVSGNPVMMTDPSGSRAAKDYGGSGYLPEGIGPGECHTREECDRVRTGFYTGLAAPVVAGVMLGGIQVTVSTVGAMEAVQVAGLTNSISMLRTGIITGSIIRQTHQEYQDYKGQKKVISARNLSASMLRVAGAGVEGYLYASGVSSIMEAGGIVLAERMGISGGLALAKMSAEAVKNYLTSAAGVINVVTFPGNELLQNIIRGKKPTEGLQENLLEVAFGMVEPIDMGRNVYRGVSFAADVIENKDEIDYTDIGDIVRLSLTLAPSPVRNKLTALPDVVNPYNLSWYYDMAVEAYAGLVNE